MSKTIVVLLLTLCALAAMLLAQDTPKDTPKHKEGDVHKKCVDDTYFTPSQCNTFVEYVRARKMEYTQKMDELRHVTSLSKNFGSLVAKLWPEDQIADVFNVDEVLDKLLHNWKIEDVFFHLWQEAGVSARLAAEHPNKNPDANEFKFSHWWSQQEHPVKKKDMVVPDGLKNFQAILAKLSVIKNRLYKN